MIPIVLEHRVYFKFLIHLGYLKDESFEYSFPLES